MRYSELTTRYFETPAAAGVLSGPGVFRGAAGNREQGTWVQFDVRARSGIVQAVRFLAFGCPHTIAVSAWVAEQALGSPVVAVLPLSAQALSERFEMPAEKLGRVLIVEDAWVAALKAAIGAAA